MPDPFRDEVETRLKNAAGAAAIDDRTAGALCAAFYKNFDTGQLFVSFPPGWDELKRVSAEGGYDGVALHHPASRTLVIVNRGTETSLPDWLQNFVAAVARAPGRQLWDAHRLVIDALQIAAAQGLAVQQVLFAGHSLGGALAEVQAMLSPSLLPDALNRWAVGVASAGFGHALKKFASVYGMTLYGDPASIITHYVRRRDVVPGHSFRLIFGREVGLASIYECRHVQDHKGTWYWKRVTDVLANHASASHVMYWDQPDTSHLWYSHGARQFTVAPGSAPKWTRGMMRPANW